MARLRNKANGVIVNVADGKSVPGFEPVVDEPATEPEATVEKPAPKNARSTTAKPSK